MRLRDCRHQIEKSVKFTRTRCLNYHIAHRQAQRTPDSTVQPSIDRHGKQQRDVYKFLANAAGSTRDWDILIGLVEEHVVEQLISCWCALNPDSGSSKQFRAFEPN